MNVNKLLRFFFATLLTAFVGQAQAAGLADLSNADAGAGLKEALAKGADYAVSNLGKTDGFLGNDKVRIRLPDSLEAAEKAMRMFGGGKQADELEKSMNRAAERAVVEAKPILLNAIKKMSVSDAKDILSGGDDSATQYFKRTTSDDIAAKFLPIVQKANAKVKLADTYNKFAGKAAGAGLIDKKDANLDSYVTQKALDGLFYMVAEQEKAIRKDPVGTGSSLLKKVFGAL
jgi:hypothetical protein